MTIPQIDIVILTWNDGDLLAAAVASASASEGVEVSVTVVDNGSDVPAVVSGARLLRNDTNLGVAPGRKQGIAATSAPFVCLLDSDARLHPDTLAQLAAPMVADESIGLAGPVFDDQLPTASGGAAPTIVRKILRGMGRTDQYEASHSALSSAGVQEVDFVIGACQLIRRSAYDQVGGLDESIFYGPEDVDLCLRMKRAGHHVVQVRGAHCFHPPRRRNRKLLSRRGLAHAWQVVRHAWRHRS